MKSYLIEKIPCSVVVCTKNEELNIERCLSNLFYFDDVVVVDSSSSDRTLEICKKYGVRIIDFVWNGRYPKKRNWSLINGELKNDWVLFLDADEYVSRLAAREIGEKIKNPHFSGYWVEYKNFFLGGELNFGDKMRKLPLFRRTQGLYQMVNIDSNDRFDMEVHEHPIINGRCGLLKNNFIHFDLRDFDSHLEKHLSYADWEVNRHNNVLKQCEQLTQRQRWKNKLINSPFFGFIYFAYSYFWKLGFLDGFTGLRFAMFKAVYFTIVHLKNIERNSKGKESQNYT